LQYQKPMFEYSQCLKDTTPHSVEGATFVEVVLLKKSQSSNFPCPLHKYSTSICNAFDHLLIVMSVSFLLRLHLHPIIMALLNVLYQSCFLSSLWIIRPFRSSATSSNSKILRSSTVKTALLPQHPPDWFTPTTGSSLTCRKERAAAAISALFQNFLLPFPPFSP